MTLDLFPSDLKPENVKNPIEKIEFYSFNEKARNAIRAVGKGIFYNEKMESKTITPPKTDNRI